MKFFKEIANEVSLGDYRKKAAMQKAQAQMGAMFTRDPDERAKNVATFNKREAGLNRLKARDEKARTEKQARELADLVARLPELKAEYEAMKAKYKSLGGSDWQYADREQNLTAAEREARSMEGPMNNLWRSIQAAEKAQGVTESRSAEDLPMYGAIIHRIMVAHTDVLAKYGPEKIMSAAEDEAEWVGDVEEIGSSDVSISVKRVIQALEEQHGVAEGVDNPTDVINVDVPMLIRVLEFAREDAQSDVDLHKVAERLIELSADGRTVTMDDYNAVVSELKTNVEEADMTTGNQGYDNMLAVMKAVDAGQDATFNLAGEPITLEYPEARFLAGKYKAFLKAGRQEEFLKYMNDPVMFDRLMKQLRDLIDKQKNFRGSVPGERGVEEGVVDTLKAGAKKALKAITGPDDEELIQRLEKETGGKRPEKKESLPKVAEGHYYCKITKSAKLIPEGYKKTADGYITRK